MWVFSRLASAEDLCPGSRCWAKANQQTVLMRNTDKCSFLQFHPVYCAQTKLVEEVAK